MDKLKIAELCHEANRIYCESIGDTSQKSWKDAPEWQKESAIKGVEVALKGSTPKEMHESWMKVKEEEGWVYGEVKDEVKKTHHCMVPYEEIPEEQRRKDDIFLGIVSLFKKDNLTFSEALNLLEAGKKVTSDIYSKGIYLVKEDYIYLVNGESKMIWQPTLVVMESRWKVVK